MTPQSGQATLTSLIDLNFILVNKLLILTMTLFFFCAVFIIRKSRGETSGWNIRTPINLSFFGFVLLYAENILAGTLPNYHLLLKGLQTIVVLLCLAKLVNYLLIDIYIPFRTRRETPPFLRDTIRLVVYLVVGVVSLRVVFDVNLSAVVTTTTVLTAMIAFALQSSLTNALSGFAIQNEKLLANRNWISIREKNIFGEIENVGFRYTTVRALDNTRLLVPNSVIIQNVVGIYGNLEYQDKPAIQIEISMDYSMPPEQARELLLDVLRNDPEVLAEPSPAVRLFSLADSAVVYQLKFWIDDPSQRVPVLDKIYTQTWYAVQRAGYSFPFPHRQVIQTESRQPFVFERGRILADLKQSELFRLLDEAALDDLSRNVPVKVFGPGEVVVRQGDVGDSLFIVINGDLGVIVDGNTVARLAADAFFGEMSLLTGEPRSATVRALGEVWLAEVTKELMEPLLRANPEILETLGNILSEREKSNQESMREITGRTGETVPKEDCLRRLKRFFGL